MDLTTYELYIYDPFFPTIYHDCLTKSQGGFYLSNGYLFKEGRLCIPLGSQKKLLIKEMHEGGLMGHFGVAKTLAMLKEKFFWPYIKREIQNHCASCLNCLHAKSSAMLVGVTSLATPPRAPEAVRLLQLVASAGEPEVLKVRLGVRFPLATTHPV